MRGINPENIFFDQAVVPKDSTGSGQTGASINMANYGKLMIAINQGSWAAGTPAVTVTQSKTSAFSASETVPIKHYYSKVAGAAKYTKTAITSDTFNLTTTNNTITLLFIDSQDLKGDDYNWIRVNTATPGGNATLIQISYLLSEPAHIRATPVDPTA